MNKKWLCLFAGCGFISGLAVSGIIKAVKVLKSYKEKDMDSDTKFERLLKTKEMWDYIVSTRRHNEDEFIIPYISKKRRAGLSDREIEKGYNELIFYGSMEGIEHVFNAFAEAGLKEEEYPYYTFRLANLIFPDIKDYLYQNS